MIEDVFKIVGTTVAGTFEVEQVVAASEFAVVYRARHLGFNANVALKCLKVPRSMTQARQEVFQAQFQAEAELLFKLSPRLPNIVRPLHVEVVSAPGGRFMPLLALEWLTGETLQAKAQRHHRSGEGMGTLQQLVTLLTPVAETLRAAHDPEETDGSVSNTHHNIRPDKLFIADVGSASVIKILDFGLGKSKSLASPSAGEASNEPRGNAFTAPEQWVPVRLGQTGPWTDVFDLAITLAELFRGRAIFDGDQAAMMSAALDENRRPTLGNAEKPVAPAVEAVFQQALAVDPKSRTQSVGEFWSELRAALRMPAEAAERDRSGSPNAAPTAAMPHSMRAHAGQELPVLRIQAAPAPIWQELVVPGAAIAGGLVLALLGQHYAATVGEVFTVGPVRLGWVTTPMVALGATLGLTLVAKRRQR